MVSVRQLGTTRNELKSKIFLSKRRCFLGGPLSLKGGGVGESLIHFWASKLMLMAKKHPLEFPKDLKISQFPVVFGPSPRMKTILTVLLNLKFEYKDDSLNL